MEDPPIYMYPYNVADPKVNSISLVFSTYVKFEFPVKLFKLSLNCISPTEPPGKTLSLTNFVNVIDEP